MKRDATEMLDTTPTSSKSSTMSSEHTMMSSFSSSRSCRHNSHHHQQRCIGWPLPKRSRAPSSALIFVFSLLVWISAIIIVLEKNFVLCVGNDIFSSSSSRSARIDNNHLSSVSKTRRTFIIDHHNYHRRRPSQNRCKSRIDCRGGTSTPNMINGTGEGDTQQQNQHPMFDERRISNSTEEATTAGTTTTSSSPPPTSTSTTEASTVVSDDNQSDVRKEEPETQVLEHVQSNLSKVVEQQQQPQQQQEQQAQSPQEQGVAAELDKQHPEDDPKVLMLIRVLFFAYYASLGSLLPYLPVYYHSLGHGGQIIGMLGAIKPFTTFLVAPLWGVISDQTGSPFVVLYFTFIVSLLGQLMVSWRHDHWWIMIMVFLTAVFNAPVKSLLDSMVMSNLKDRSRYGRLRLWGQLGFGVGSSCVGYLLSQSRHEHVPYTPKSEGTSWMQHLDDVWQTITGYKLLFFTHLMLSIPTFVCIHAFDQMTLERQQQQQEQKQLLASKQTEGGTENDENITKTDTKPSVLDGINVLLHNSDAMFFFFLVLVVGISSGVIENFAYVRIREVGGTGKEMGLCRLVSSLAGAPMFWFSGPLTELLGADRVIVVGLINYVVRYFNYALIKSPLQALPAEALRGMTFAAFWSTCTIYATRIAPPGMQATMLMFLNAMYGGLGQSLGAIIGGKLQSHVGTVQTFLYSGLFDALFVGLVIAYLKVRKDSSFKNPQPIVPKPKKQ